MQISVGVNLALQTLANLCHKLFVVTSHKDSVMSIAAAMWLCIVGGGKSTLYQVTFLLRITL